MTKGIDHSADIWVACSRCGVAIRNVTDIKASGYFDGRRPLCESCREYLYVSKAR
jgi:hypothetical protein